MSYALRYDKKENNIYLIKLQNVNILNKKKLQKIVLILEYSSV